VLSQTLDAVASLSTLSERGRVVPELDDPSIREESVFPYRLLDQVRESTVVVLALLRGARDFHTWRADSTRRGRVAGHPHRVRPYATGAAGSA
jgi:hypothetical protein